MAGLRGLCCGELLCGLCTLGKVHSNAGNGMLSITYHNQEWQSSLQVCEAMRLLGYDVQIKGTPSKVGPDAKADVYFVDGSGTKQPFMVGELKTPSVRHSTG